MEFLSGENIWEVLRTKCSSCVEQVVFVSAYAKADAFRVIAASVGNREDIRKAIVVRWAKADLVSGASDLELYSLSKLYGWDVYIDTSLHAKVYKVDSWYLVGSANLTASGFLLDGGRKNIEACLTTEDNSEISDWLERIVSMAVPLDDELYEEIAREVLATPTPIKISEWGFSSIVVSLMRRRLAAMCFYTGDLFWTETPEALLNSQDLEQLDLDGQHDGALLAISFPADVQAIKAHFVNSIGWRWLMLQSIEPCYFGALSEALHSALLDDPAVFRKDVKGLLSNLLSWAVYLCPENCIVDRPNYSQRIQVV